MAVKTMNDTPKTQEMNNIITWILATLQKQGLSFLLLGLAVWYFQAQNDQLQSRITSCNSDIIEIYKSQNAHMIDVINSNTKALEEMIGILREHDTKKK